MNDPSRPSLLERPSALIMREPGARAELAQLLRSAYSRNLLDADAMSIIEGALTASEMQARDIMIPRAPGASPDIHEPGVARVPGRAIMTPRAQVAFTDITEPVESFIPQVISPAHSRFPVIDQS